MIVASFRKKFHGLICRLPSLFAGMPTHTISPRGASTSKPSWNPAILAEKINAASTPPRSRWMTSSASLASSACAAPSDFTKSSRSAPTSTPITS
jgi:hypothetical protein